MNTCCRLHLARVTLLAAAFVCTLAPRTFAGGGPGNALQFSVAPVGLVTVSNAPALNAYPITVTCWIKTTQFTFGAAPVALVSKSLTEPGWQLTMINGNGTLAAGYAPSFSSYVGSGPIGLTGGVVNDGQWHHVAFTVDASGGRLYRDGVLQASGGWVGTPGAVSNLADVTFGSFSAASWAYVGLMDEVTLWNVALSQAQIQSNMNRSLTGTEPGLIAYYRCDETAGPTSFDSAPAGGTNHGVWNSVTATNSTLVPFTPFVETVAASAVGPTNATLNGVANAWGTNTSVWFEWGTTTNYGSVTAMQAIGNGTNGINFAQLVPGLNMGSAYHFRAVASNAWGVVWGTNASFAAPVFTLVNTGPGLNTRSNCIAVWGDLNNDGRLDIAQIAGFTNYGLFGVWLNNGGQFTNSYSSTNQMNSGKIALADYNHSGRLDFFYYGLTQYVDFNNSFATNYTVLSSNTAAGFGPSGITLPIQYSTPAVAWVDYDRNGSLDLYVSNGYEAGKTNATIWENPNPALGERGRQLRAATLPMVATGAAQAAWGDYDNDGHPDLAFSGIYRPPTYPQGNQTYHIEIWRNTASGFSNINAGFTDGYTGAMAWGDYDNDGLLDLLRTGISGTNPPIAQIWRNTGAGFTNINAGLTGVQSSSVAWGDYDNDGLLDLVLAGLTDDAGNYTVITEVWRNTGSGFMKINAGLPNVGFGSVAWGDYNNDGRLDLLLAGTGMPVQVWQNNTPATNTPPTAPTALRLSGAELTWNAASDAQTPAVALTYNLRIGTAPGAIDVLAPASLSSGPRLLPAAGNLPARTNISLDWLAPNQTYYLSVQAVDNAYAASPFSDELAFSLHSVTGPSGATSPTPGDQNGDGIVSQSELAAVLASLNGNGVVTEAELNLVLSNYWPNSPWLQLTNVAGLGGTNVTFALTNSLAGAFSVESTTNLVDWNFLGPATPRYEFTDTNAPALPQRYYRLRWP